MEEMKRVVLTGLGVIGPVGNNSEDFWNGIKSGKNGIDVVTKIDVEPHKAKLGGEVKDFVYHDKRAAKRLDLSVQYALTAADEAVKDSGLVAGENIDPYRFGVYGSAGIGGLITLEKESVKCAQKGVKWVSPLMIPMTIPNMVSGNISIMTGAKGATMSIATACATGTHSVGEAFRSIKHGYHDAIIAGGTEAPFADVAYAGFANMTALTVSTDKDRASIPFDAERNGFVMGEGSAFLVLEELEHAKARGAHIYAEITGYGATSDAHHITMPDPEGAGDAKAMEFAMQEAGITPEDIDYINAHGTSTPYNDKFETVAIKRAFGDAAYKVAVSSTKSMTGHLLGAAGAVEAFICVKALEDGFIPATINYKVPDPELDLDYVPNEGRNADLEYVMSNSLGFGGHDGVIIMKKWDGK